MSTYVLVHGAWGGAHTWKLVRPGLWGAGHHVFTPGLTGIGDRVHLASPQVNLTTHIDDVVNQIVYEDLSDIVLLGFSYGGMVVTGALAHIADRVRELVYLDAFLPTDGQSLGDLAGHSPIAPALGDPWLVPPRPREMDDPVEASWNEPRRTPQPARTFSDKVRLARPVEDYPFGRTYIKALDDPRRTDGPNQFWDAAERVRDHPAWRYREIDTNHMIPQNRPAELVEILLELA
jgi:pimeloyl-ACP methyl ester carboxylesterase